MAADTRPSAGLARLAAATLMLLAGLGCRQDMHDQPKYKPFSDSDFYANGSAMRVPIEGTVARGRLGENGALETGFDDAGDFVSALPIAVDRAVLLRGQERFGIFCSPCHGALGDGQGMVVQRGYKQPPSFHEQRLREMPAGYYFDVMTNGFGQMQSYRSQVPTADRWAIVAYLRALQLSQGAPLSALPADAAAKADHGDSAPTESTSTDEHADHHL